MARRKMANATLRIDPDKYAALRQLADRRGLSVADLLREMGEVLIEQEGFAEPQGKGWSTMRQVWPWLSQEERQSITHICKALAADRQEQAAAGAGLEGGDDE